MGDKYLHAAGLSQVDRRHMDRNFYAKTLHSRALNVTLTKLQLAATANHNQVNKKDFYKGKTSQRGEKATKEKNLNRLASLIPGAGDVVVRLMITSGNVQQSIQCFKCNKVGH